MHVNVSFDGFRPESHGKFRGSRSSFEVTVATPLDLVTLDGSQNVSGWHRWVYRNLYDPLITRSAPESAA